jgi:hypothetical protein
MNIKQKDVFLIEELEARLEMTTVTLADGTVVESPDANQTDATSKWCQIDTSYCKNPLPW